jgi:hypothetical protein
MQDESELRYSGRDLRRRILHNNWSAIFWKVVETPEWSTELFYGIDQLDMEDCTVGMRLNCGSHSRRNMEAVPELSIGNQQPSRKKCQLAKGKNSTQEQLPHYSVHQVPKQLLVPNDCVRAPPHGSLPLSSSNHNHSEHARCWLQQAADG